jgi:hypothetical protein
MHGPEIEKTISQSFHISFKTTSGANAAYTRYLTGTGPTIAYPAYLANTCQLFFGFGPNFRQIHLFPSNYPSIIE